MRLDITTKATEPIAECAVRSLYIVVFPPAFDDDLCFSQAVEERSVQQFVAEPGIEALDRALLPRATRFDDGCLCTAASIQLRIATCSLNRTTEGHGSVLSLKAQIWDRTDAWLVGRQEDRPAPPGARQVRTRRTATLLGSVPSM